MKPHYFFVLCFISPLFLASCTKTPPLVPDPTGNPLVTGGFTYFNPSESADQYGHLFITDANGNPVIDAGVTLSYGSDSIPLTYAYTTTGPVTYDFYGDTASVTEVTTAAYITSLTPAYSPGQAITVDAVFGGVDHSASVTVLGDIQVTDNSSYATASWAGGGDQDVINILSSVSPSTKASYGPGSLASPYDIPYVAPTGDNQIYVLLSDNAVFSGASNISNLQSYSSAATVF